MDGWRAGLAVAVAVAALGCLTASAGAKVVHANGHTYGVMYRAERSLLAGVLSGPQILNSGPAQSPLTYGGAPLMLSSSLHLIFWGPAGSFAATYEGPIIQWAKDLAAASATNTNAFSVTRQYANASGTHITGAVTFGGSVDDTHAYPAKTGACTSDTTTPCIMDSQLQAEIIREIGLNGWPTDPAGTPEAQYIVLLPTGVDGCIDALAGDCTFGTGGGYCGYHGQRSTSTGNIVIYAEVPYEPGCDSGQAPSGTDANPDTDGALDTMMHEVAEDATDPENGNGWTDAGGYEIGDKCDGSSVSLTSAQIYGTPLGGSLSANTAFNQLINADSYYTQQLWSNQATKTPSSTTAAGCSQRFGPSPVFAPPTGVVTGTAASFDGSRSYDISRPISSYRWSFGDGSPVQGGSVQTHIFDKPGNYTVALTVGDASGVANQSTESRVLSVTGSTLVPAIASLTPAGAITGSSVTIDGSNLASASSVRFNGRPAKIVSDSPAQITTIVPNGASTGPVTVTTAGGTATSASSFTVTLSITSFSPTSGAPGTSVTIHGVGFNTGSTVAFNGVAAAGTAFASSSQLSAVVPAGATSGPITVTNTTAPVGTVRSAASYTP